MNAPIAPIILTVRKKQVIQLLVEGNTFSQIGASLGISKKTVNKHILVMREKYGVRTTYELIAHVVARGDVYVFLGETAEMDKRMPPVIG